MFSFIVPLNTKTLNIPQVLLSLFYSQEQGQALAENRQK